MLNQQPRKQRHTRRTVSSVRPSGSAEPPAESLTNGHPAASASAHLASSAVSAVLPEVQPAAPAPLPGAPPAATEAPLPEYPYFALICFGCFDDNDDKMLETYQTKHKSKEVLKLLVSSPEDAKRMFTLGSVDKKQQDFWKKFNDQSVLMINAHGDEITGEVGTEHLRISPEEIACFIANNCKVTTFTLKNLACSASISNFETRLVVKLEELAKQGLHNVQSIKSIAADKATIVGEAPGLLRDEDNFEGDRWWQMLTIKHPIPQASKAQPTAPEIKSKIADSNEQNVESSPKPSAEIRLQPQPQQAPVGAAAFFSDAKKEQEAAEKEPTEEEKALGIYLQSVNFLNEIAADSSWGKKSNPAATKGAKLLSQEHKTQILAAKEGSRLYKQLKNDESSLGDLLKLETSSPLAWDLAFLLALENSNIQALVILSIRKPEFSSLVNKGVLQERLKENSYKLDTFLERLKDAKEDLTPFRNEFNKPSSLFFQLYQPDMVERCSLPEEQSPDVPDERLTRLQTIKEILLPSAVTSAIRLSA